MVIEDSLCPKILMQESNYCDLAPLTDEGLACFSSGSSCPHRGSWKKLARQRGVFTGSSVSGIGKRANRNGMGLSVEVASGESVEKARVKNTDLKDDTTPPMGAGSQPHWFQCLFFF